ncbi:MAG TPA: acetyl-CoA carboxylase biotin carboxylase subunit, partial [Blastocatellia bacterium]|nr:acetyl-CoA carboxylase biotin carboxylase subunit [Blastocatellia bacterium]
MKTKSFHKILIANRGEIALRILRTCRRLGIATAAVYSDHDLRAPHTATADEAVHIGPAPSQASYLNIENVLAAARKVGADAVHPGYGFLSENADFALACETAGLVFIGPGADAIRTMGLKSVAKRIAAENNVPFVPGYAGPVETLHTMCEQAEEIGFPILIKASAGGGGKGMRVVRQAGEMQEALQSSRREAEKAFGDGSLLLEKYIENARHVEVQIFGDHYGNVLQLFERDCSIQRRHQKIIEESPSPFVTPELRRRMGEAAIALGRAIGYTSAGTVEFILTPSGEFYFIEVNTRLQVEHPVTEMITGLDLVELQIRVAEGHPLPFTQADLRASGHAIEARLYAEDPANDFLPATGTIHNWQFPQDTAGVRLDGAIETGLEIGIYYDPMLAKVIAHAADRHTAIRKLASALKQLGIQGVATNKDFLVKVLEHPEFAAGAYDTGFIPAHTSELAGSPEAAANPIAAAVAATYLLNCCQR